MENLAPTRMNLLSRRAQIKLASDGVNLLKGKREALLKELLEQARQLRSLREDLSRRGRQARSAIAMARAVRGTAQVRSVGHAGRRNLSVTVGFDRVWGLELSSAETHNLVRLSDDRGIGRLDASPHILEAARAAEGTLELLIRCAPPERNIQLLGDEICKTTRRINALEEHLVPRLKQEVRLIARVLDEREREDRFRLKRVKRKKAKV